MHGITRPCIKYIPECLDYLKQICIASALREERTFLFYLEHMFITVVRAAK